MEYWHTMLASEERATLLPDESRLRAGVRAVVAVAPEELVAFNLVDSHVHLVILGDRARAGRVAQAASLALRPLVAAVLGPARIKEVEGRSHLERLVAFVLRQDRGHGTGRHPALAAGSCFQDLCGARSIEGLQLRLGDALPRYRLRQAFAEVGLAPEPLRPADDDRIRRLGPAQLVAASTAACCVDPSLSGRASRSVKRARRAAASIARKVGIRGSELTELLARRDRSLRELASCPEDPAAESATRVRLALVERVAEDSRVVAEAPGADWEYGDAPAA